jgi:hypothetical protein
VKKAAAQTSSPERFYLLLAESLSDIDRTRFLKEVGAGSSAGPLALKRRQAQPGAVREKATHRSVISTTPASTRVSIHHLRPVR